MVSTDPPNVVSRWEIAQPPFMTKSGRNQTQDETIHLLANGCVQTEISWQPLFHGIRSRNTPQETKETLIKHGKIDPSMGKMARMRRMRRHKRWKTNSSNLTPFNQKHDYGWRANFLFLRTKMKLQFPGNSGKMDFTWSQHTGYHITKKLYTTSCVVVNNTTLKKSIQNCKKQRLVWFKNLSEINQQIIFLN